MKTRNIFFATTVSCLSTAIAFSQNIAVNTSGAAGAATNMFEVTQTSAAANMVAIYAIHSGATAGTGYGLYSTKTGASTTNIAGYFDASGGTNNFPGIFMGGNVGIGIASPQRKLDVQQSSDAVSSGIGILNTAATVRLNLWMNGTAGQIDAGGTGQNNLLLNAGGGAGKVGIGTTNPLAKLHVEASTAFFRNTAVNSSGVEIYGGTDGTSSSSIYMKNPAGTISTFLSDGTYSSYLNYTGGNVGIATNNPIRTLHVNGSFEAAYSDDNMVLLNVQAQNSLKSGLAIGYNQIYNGVAMTNAGFLQAETQGSGYRSILINPIAGNVGIGTTTPTAHLEVRDLTSGAYSLHVTKDFNGFGNTTAAFIGGTDGVYGNTGIYVDQKDGLGLNTATSFIFNVVNNTVSQMLVTGLGNVGIGTTTPGDYLAITGGITIGNQVFGSGFNGIYLNGLTGTGDYNILSKNADQTLYINRPAAKDIRFRENNTDQVIIQATTGNVGIGTTTPGYKLDVAGSFNATTLYCNTAFWCSDERYKKDVASLQNPLENVMKLRGVNYYWKTNDFPEKLFSDSKQIGFIAQEIETIYPELVSTNKDGYKSVDYSHLTPILVEAMKEQQNMIEQLKNDKALSDARIEKLEKMVGLLVQTSQK